MQKCAETVVMEFWNEYEELPVPDVTKGRKKRLKKNFHFPSTSTTTTKKHLEEGCKTQRAGFAHLFFK